ncbi:MAG: M28 family peptidase [Eubacterium sp.]|nr:M28 family peptidase [Eubacterium sp.]
MNLNELKKIFDDNDFVHTSGTPEELKVAEYLKKTCDSMGVEAQIEAFPVPMAEMMEAHVFADGREIPCKGFYGCGSGETEAELYYMPGTDKVSIAGAKDKIVLLDSQGVTRFVYQDLMKAGAAGILFQYGNMYYGNNDIDQRDLRKKVVGDERRVLCAMLHTRDAAELVKNGTKRIRIIISQNEYEGESHNVTAFIPGRRDEYITLSAHYDTTSLSHGAYDNLTGCAGLLGVMDSLKDRKLNYGLKFVFCGSEERGLLGSESYVRDHEEEIKNTVLNINLDMIGSILGKFFACVTAEDRLAHYISYMGAEVGFPVGTRTGVYSSDSTNFADKGVPAVTFARLASGNAAPIHCRYDLQEVLSMEQLAKDIGFITEFTRRMADAAVCPVSREMPEKIKKELDEYLYRKRKEE